MGQTEKYNLPYPSEDDYLKDTAEFIKNLAESTETTMETLENNKLDKTSKATSTEAIAGTNNTKYTTPYSVKSAIDKALEGYTPSDGGSGGDTLPIGAILPFSGDIIPNGWLLCDGSVIKQEDYPELFEVLAGNYGIISREEIRLPDLRGKVTVGKDSTDADFDTLGNTGGEKTHTLTVSELPSHSHIINSFRQYETGSSTDSSKLGRTTTGADGGSSTIATGETGGNEAHNNLQPYIVTNYIIKAKMTVAIEGEIIQEDGTATTENVYSATAINNKISTNIITSEEVVTNEYRNGKRVYIRYIIAEVENSSGTSVDINIPSFSYTEMWIDESNSFITNSSETLAINWYFAPDDYSRVWVNKSTGKIRYRMGGNLSGRNFEIVLKYTKD